MTAYLTTRCWTLLCLCIVISSFDLNGQCNSLPNASSVSISHIDTTILIDAANPSCVTDMNSILFNKMRGKYVVFNPLSGNSRGRKYVTNIQKEDELEYDISGLSFSSCSYRLTFCFASKQSSDFKIYVQYNGNNEWVELSNSNNTPCRLPNTNSRFRLKWETDTYTLQNIGTIDKIKIKLMRGNVNINYLKVNYTQRQCRPGNTDSSNNKTLSPRSTSRITTTFPTTQDFTFEELTINTYPNPAAQQLNFDLNLPTDSHVKLNLYNAIGQHVKIISDEQLIGGQQHQLSTDVSGLQAGIYFYRLETDQGKSITGRIVIE